MGMMRNVSRLVGPAVLPKISYQKRIIDTYTHFYLSEKVAKNTILYESRDGKSLTDSPFAIFEYLLERDKRNQYTHIWVVTKNEELAEIQKKYLVNSNVLFVIRNSDEYLKWLTKAQILINNSTFQPFVTIKEDQTYINTWHGTPLKTMGFDIPGNPANAKNVVRNFFIADYLISPNAHTTKMFIDSYQLNDNFKGKIIENGYPRIDQTFHTTKEEVIETLREYGVSIDQHKKTLLYTPTCKDGSLAMTTDQVAQIHQEMSLIRKRFNEEYNVLIKVHPFLYEQAKRYQGIRPFLVPDVLDTNKILAGVDCLITDYSSIFFDFLVTDKPILFYCWDDDLYGNERGKYIEYEDLPGPVSFSIEELTEAIKDLSKNQEKYAEKYQAFKEIYTPYDDGLVTERLVDLILKDIKVPNVTIIEAPTDKKRLLIYPGGMRSNGITSSFLNLLESIDYTKYSVVCFLDNINSDDQITNVSNIPKNVTLLFRFEAPNYTAKEHYQDLFIQLKGVKNEGKYPQDIYQREVRRLLGGQTYETAIDFSGYSLHWSKMILASTANRYVCFLHSDMKLDQQRVVNGRKIHYINLQGIFSIYKRYDKLASVSEVINKINKEKLSEYASPDKFVYATNTINPRKILGEIKENQPKVMVETTRLYRDGVIRDITQEITIRTSRPDMSLGSLLKRKFDSENVLVLGSFEYKGTIYYKITKDNVYIGWIDSQDIDVFPVKILAEKKVNYFGKINTTDHDMIYSGPIGLATSVPLEEASKFKNIYVAFEKEIITQEHTSLELVINGKKVGYIPKNKVSYSRRLNWTKNNQLPLKHKVLRNVTSSFNRIGRKKQFETIDHTPISRDKIEAYYKNPDKQMIIGYKKPDTNSGHWELGTPEHIYILSEVATSQELFYEIQDALGDIYWVRKNDLALIPLNAEEVILEKDINKTVVVKNENIDVFASVKDCLINHGTLVQAKKELQVTKSIMTSAKREFLLTNWEGKHLWIKKEEATQQEVEGVFNALGQFFPFPDESKVNIVTTGRLSQEKNQQVLIEAFALFKKMTPNSQLFIIGTGPEENNLRNKINELDLNNSVILMGQIYNPFTFMRECQLFALTSLYEGQSLVLLEALTLGMTCLSTDIPACRKVLVDGKYGLLTDTNDVVGVYKGLEKLITDPISFQKFDPYTYNEQAINLFYQLLR